MQPTIGRVVHYTLSELDADHIQRDRAEQSLTRVGNPALAGETYPADVVRTWGGPAVSPAVNLQVKLDGNDTHWVTSRCEGEPGEQGHWIWPPRV